MPRKTSASVLPLLAVLALALPGKAVAGPPEGVSGKMVLDEAADGLRRYRGNDAGGKALLAGQTRSDKGSTGHGRVGRCDGKP